MSEHRISLTVNRVAHEAEVPARLTLADFLRERLDVTSVHLGCEHGVCGACTVLVDGESARSCLMLAVACDEREVETIEGFAGDPVMAALRRTFHQRHALQCGFCTPGFLMLAEAYFAERGLAPPAAPGQPPPGPPEEPTEAEIRELVASNLCRCTGYQGIVAAMLATARSRRAAGPG